MFDIALRVKISNVNDLLIASCNRHICFAHVLSELHGAENKNINFMFPPLTVLLANNNTRLTPFVGNYADEPVPER